MTSPQTERRQGPDRRRQPRSGRRPGDKPGFAPLVLVADDDRDSNARCEAILARLRFAVAPAHSADEAVRVMHVLRPNLVVSHLKDGAILERSMAADPNMAGVPIVKLTRETEEPQALVEEIRRVLRENPPRQTDF
jgi:PleD family two-component response regulator